MANYDRSQIQSGPADVEQERALTGTATTTTGSPTVTGTSTKFLTELSVGQTASIDGVDFVVLSITSDTVATATANVTPKVAKTMTAFYNLGLTRDGITETVDTTTYVIDTDQLGEVGEIISGRKVMLEINLTQWNGDNLALCFPESLALLKDTTTFLSRLSPSIGLDIAGLGKRLRIVPVKGGTQTTDAGFILTYWIVGSSADSNSFKWGKDTQRILTVKQRSRPHPAHNNEFRYVGNRALLT